MQIGARQPGGEQMRARGRGGMDSPSDQQAAPKAHNVGMEAHRAVGVEESGRDGDGNRVSVWTMIMTSASP